jgi:hypothetical protein
VPKACYRILDLRVCLESDHQGLFDRFDEDYRAFHENLAETDSPSQPDCELALIARVNGGSPRIVINGVDHSLVGHPHPPSGAYAIVLREIFAGVKRFLLVHASVASRDGAALVLSGRGGIGKTTLLLRLLEQGFTFFSDDVCPVETSSGLVFPFQRTAWVKGDGEHKRPVAMKGVPDSHPSPCHARLVLLLTEGGAEREEAVLRIQLKRAAPAELLDGLLSLPQVLISRPSGASTLLEVRYRADRHIGAQIRRLLGRHEDAIWSALRLDDYKEADFEREPEARRIGAAEMALFLAGQMKQDFLSPHARLSPGGLVFQLGELLGGAVAYQIKTGRLDSLVVMTERIWKDAGSITSGISG